MCVCVCVHVCIYTMCVRIDTACANEHFRQNTMVSKHVYIFERSQLGFGFFKVSPLEY